MVATSLTSRDSEHSARPIRQSGTGRPAPREDDTFTRPADTAEHVVSADALFTPALFGI